MSISSHPRYSHNCQFIFRTSSCQFGRHGGSGPPAWLPGAPALPGRGLELIKDGAVQTFDAPGSPYYHKNMKTTLNLPPDVAHTLRMESARRGGRKAASLSKLVADAVRIVYGNANSPSARTLLTPGRVVIHPAPDAPKLTADRIRDLLSDDSLDDEPKRNGLGLSLCR